MGIDESTTIKNPAAKRTKNIVSFKTSLQNTEEYLQVHLSLNHH